MEQKPQTIEQEHEGSVLEPSFTERLDRIHSTLNEIDSLVKESDALINWEFDKEGKEKATFSKDPKVQKINDDIFALLDTLREMLPENKRRDFINTLRSIPSEGRTAELLVKHLYIPPAEEKPAPPKKGFFKRTFGRV